MSDPTQLQIHFHLSQMSIARALGWSSVNRTHSFPMSDPQTPQHAETLIRLYKALFARYLGVKPSDLVAVFEEENHEFQYKKGVAFQVHHALKKHLQTQRKKASLPSMLNAGLPPNMIREIFSRI